MQKDAGLMSVMDELRTLEPLIYAANSGVPRSAFENRLAHDFWEVGASGRVYTRDFVLSTLDERQKNPREEVWSAYDFSVRKIEDSHYLLTYALQQPTRLSRRATLWQMSIEGWKMLYHQGTPVI